MANDLDNLGEVLDHTLDDYLLGLAQGIQQAQIALNQLTVPSGASGQAPVAYHLPRLDFELRLHLAMQSGTAATGNSKQLRWRPASPGAGDSFSAEAVSTIRGSFVSVPAANGRPGLVLNTTMSLQSAREMLIGVTVSDTLGAAQADVEVHFNVDRERSATLSATVSPKLTLNPATNVKDGLQRSDAQGKAATMLSIASSEPVGALIAVTVDIIGASETLLVPVLAGSPNVADR